MDNGDSNAKDQPAEPKRHLSAVPSPTGEGEMTHDEVMDVLDRASRPEEILGTTFIEDELLGPDRDK